ncbi:MAG: hypothetical protein JXQ66_04310 [Campylobacterales bacterium]|nr:hypothetical protein [Campylobacterales bacterium]
MANHDIIHCKLNTESGLISMREFSYFQYHFISMYSFAYDMAKKSGINPNELTKNNIAHLVEIIESEAIQKGSRIISNYARMMSIPNEEDLYIDELDRVNPINIGFSGLALILVVAIVISGGKIEISNQSVKAELPPLGVGLKEIKNLFKDNNLKIDSTKQVTIKK